MTRKRTRVSSQDLHELLAKARSALPGSPPKDLADLVLQWGLGAANPGKVLRPAVLSWVQDQERARVREAEREAFPAKGRGRAEPYVNPAQEAMAALLRATVFVPGEGMVPWGDLTTGLHGRRARYLEATLKQYAAGIRDTITRHVRAAEVLAESGFSTLAEYAGANGSIPPGTEPPPRAR